MSSYEKILKVSKIERVYDCSDKKILPYKNQNFETLRDECLRTGRLFEDPSFLANGKNIFYKNPLPYGTHWARPKEISRTPVFIENGVDANDLDQGLLGDCWFVAACSAIALVPELFENVVPTNQSLEGQHYAGIFHFRFWYFGQWVDVVIDDRLPVDSYNKLMFCRNRQQPNEFWAALLEKAYAKLCGSYENLDGGNTTDALIDFTGGISESFEIKDMQTERQKNEIWSILVKSRMHKSLIGASIAPNPRIRESRLTNGLVMGHAYTITKIAAIELGIREIKLIRVRNPWGNEVEWKGPWSDNAYEWNRLANDVKEGLNYQNMPDGEFWMAYDDFYKNFESLQFCELTPDAYSTELMTEEDNERLTWKLTSFHSEWIPGKSSGGSGKSNEALYWNNPQFIVTLTDIDMHDNQNMVTIIISLMQKYKRQERMNNNGEDTEEFIQFRLYRILNQNDAESAKKNGKRLNSNQLEKIGVSGPYINQREVIKRFRTLPGTYLIIPSCFDVGVQGEFLIRLYTESPIGEQNCSILENPRPASKDKDVFFNPPKSIENLFNNWTNLMIDQKVPNQQKSNYSNENFSSQLEGLTPIIVKPSRIYSDEVLVNIHHKVDVKRKMKQKHKIQKFF